MKKRFFWLFSSFLLVTMVAGFGCRGLSTEEQAAVKPTTLQYWTVHDNVAELRTLAEEYKRIRSYVTVNIRQVRYEEFDELFLNALADDVAPDIISIQARLLPQYVRRLAYMPPSVDVATIWVEGKYRPETIVTMEKKSMPTVNSIKKDFIATVADDVIINKKIYGLPTAVDTMAIYYNKDLLDNAGIPEPPTTWAEFLDAVKKTTKFDSEGRIVQSGTALGSGANVQYVSDILALLFAQNGIPMTVGNTVTFAQNVEKGGADSPSMQAIKFYTDFARPTSEAYTWNGDLDNSFDAFVRGKVVFYFGFSFDYDRIKAQAPQLNMDVIPLPQLNEGSPVNVANYWIQSVVAKSEHQNEAWDFIRFLTTPENIKKYTDATKQPTPLRAHIEAQKEDERLLPFVGTVLNAANWYRGNDIEVANQTLAEMADRLLEPYGETQNPFERDRAIIKNAAAVLQQTM
ncbi:MAG TPA: hypothetical protein DCY48_02645 [Candidatus Magasanikbacteria bacterium]|nr:MAG: hypothetical protein A3I74_02915 [Candidatus Magasanikbacteria bacterium RIFCSPLOWO2_02_FULL_47_16]OGH79558.1 MAG: hypothetical protein A3C10_00490 [Candidatus Magasanikbacteria bacterium RIFCSPHIGHO2_02_FULL_48_18]HAZ28651.1 hypothetical protein [Candidatus Magasanikbacteria bacterium]